MTNFNKPQNGSCSQIPYETSDAYFFPRSYSSAKAKMARKICESCVELNECQTYALENDLPYGILAGMSPKERNDIKYGGSAA